MLAENERERKMNGKKLLLLGGSPGSREIIQYAQSQGIHTIVTDWVAPEHSEAKKMADSYWMDSYTDYDKIERKCREEEVDAIITASSDYAIESMIELCDRLHLPCYCTKESFHYSKNKADFKEVCKKTGLNVPRDYLLTDALTEEELDQVEFPVVVKPVDQNDSIGISFCNNKEELINAYRKARSVSKNPKIIVEEKINGKEFVAYYALADGEVAFLFFHSLMAPKEFAVKSSFVASNVTPFAKDFMEQMNEKIICSLKEMGCKDNIAWVQVIMNQNGDFYAIEMGHRFGADIIPIEYSHVGEIDIVKWAVECAMGTKHLEKDLPSGLGHAIKRYIYSYELCCGREGVVKEILGKSELMHKNIDVKITVNIGEVVHPEMGMGCVGFCADSIDEICILIEEINQLLQINNSQGENMILQYMSAERFMKEEFSKAI